MGLDCRLLLRTPDPSSPPPPEGNLLLDRMTGAEIVWITPAEYKIRDELFEREAASLREKGRRPFMGWFRNLIAIPSVSGSASFLSTRAAFSDYFPKLMKLNPILSRIDLNTSSDTRILPCKTSQNAHPRRRTALIPQLNRTT